MYRVPNDNSLFDEIIGVWCTDNMECKNMSFEDARKYSQCLCGKIIDENIKDCLFFTFYDAINHGLEKDEFVEIAYKELIAECELIEIVTYEREEWVDIDKAKMHGYFL